MVISGSDIVKFSEELRAAGKKIIFTNGCFDILHVGHVRYLNQARSLGDCLIVGLNSDASVRKLKGSSRPINNEADRAEVLGGLKAVDFVVVFAEPTAESLISKVRPAVYAKGGDYCLDNLPEAKIVQSYGGTVELIPFVDGKSSTKIIQRIQSSN